MQFLVSVKKLFPVLLLILPFFLHSEEPEIEIIISGASHAAGVENGISNPASKGALQGLADFGVVNSPHSLTYFGPQKITEVPKLMAHHAVYTEFLRTDLQLFIRARQSINPKVYIGVILPEFVWLRFVTSYNPDTLNKIKNNDFNPVINREPLTLFEYVATFKNAIFGQIYYHLRHRPDNISECQSNVKDSLRHSIDLLERIGEGLGVIFLVAGMPQQLRETGALKDNRVHIYEPIAKIIPNDDQSFLRHYLTWIFLYTPDQMDKLPQIRAWIHNPPQFHEGMVEEVNDFARLYSRDKRFVHFYDMGGYLKRNGNRLALKGADGEILSFGLDRIFNQNETSPLHLYKDAYDLTSILFVEAILLSLGESFNIDTSGFINQKRREGLVRRRAVEFDGKVLR
ncbi:hypothetical protein [Endozoicomonas elysicola]|uniref:Uncharacterized protein n=1 Tax=Endozoicomonas elysicola TaxID=305900 RepID=A0A081KFZ8_9GAMM|nr:hypothetical protein [Endozoicomonas elysicola]KEI73074.1 hypothetical protein GV64_22285 [Endozoicomonas elysicola]